MFTLKTKKMILKPDFDFKNLKNWLWIDLETKLWF